MEPAVSRHSGACVKYVADNIFAVFPRAKDALAAGIHMHAITKQIRESRPELPKINICLGIGFGDLLVIDRWDAFGHEVNMAFKLAEDIALPGEILLTESAQAELTSQNLDIEERNVSVSGILIAHGALQTKN